MNCREFRELAPLHLSGELEDDSAFHAHLSECRPCAEHLEQQEEADARLRKALPGLPDTSAIERRVGGQIARERSKRWAMAAAAAVLFAAIPGYKLLRPDRVYADAARDHRLEVIEHQPRHWRSDPAEVEKLAARYGLSDVAALAPAGYRLEHAKMCGLDGQPALHLVYTNGSQEVSLFVRWRAGGHGEHATGVGRVAEYRNGRMEIIATGGDCLPFVRHAAGVL